MISTRPSASVAEATSAALGMVESASPITSSSGMESRGSSETTSSTGWTRQIPDSPGWSLNSSSTVAAEPEIPSAAAEATAAFSIKSRTAASASSRSVSGPLRLPWLAPTPLKLNRSVGKPAVAAAQAISAHKG